MSELVIQNLDIRKSFFCPAKHNWSMTRLSLTIFSRRKLLHYWGGLTGAARVAVCQGEARSAASGDREERDQSQSVIAVMSTDIQREESFRTALRNQKRRLSATEKKPSVTEFSSAVNKSVLGGLKTRDSLTPPRRDLLTPPRSSFTPPR